MEGGGGRGRDTPGARGRRYWALDRDVGKREGEPCKPAERGTDKRRWVEERRSVVRLKDGGRGPRWDWLGWEVTWAGDLWLAEREQDWS
eukprot:3702895-Rhodomonas_salina.1